MTTAAPPLAPSEFELFAEDAAGQPLPVYGRQLFSQVPTTFAPMEHIPVPANYALGPGDQLLIRAWGKIDLDTTVTVDRNGQIFVPKVGALSVAGLRYEQIESYVRSAIANLYKDFELNVTMGQLRSIQIFVLGSARQPGAYTVSSLSTLVNALFASGGPAATGSMRRIELRRGGLVVTEFDLYELLRNGDKSRDAQLLPGDVIYIPPVGPQVAIYGSVDEPGVYELKGETTVATALKNTGGLTNLAETDRVLLERIENHRRRRVDEFALDASGLQRELEDGDMLEIFPISPRFDDAVTLRGNVAQPGRFLWHEGMRISDLVPSRDSLITRRYWNLQNHLVSPLTAVGPQNQQSQPNSLLNATGTQNQQSQPYSLLNATGTRNQQNQPPFNTVGAQNQPGAPGTNLSSGGLWSPDSNVAAHPHLDVMTDLAQNTAEINWDYAAIERLDPRDLSTHVIAFNLGKALDDPASSDNLVLQPRDVVTIFSRADLPLPEDKHAAFVRISGEVNAPGVYRIKSRETLREAVQQAGGLTQDSYIYGTVLNRLSAQQIQQQQLDASIVQMKRDLTSRIANSQLSLTTTSQGNQSASEQLALEQNLINQMSSIRPTGRVVLGLNPRMRRLEDLPSFALEDGDTIVIPARLNTVQIVGEVYNPNAFRYDPRATMHQYLNAAGGPTRNADASHIYILRADGTIIPHDHGIWRVDIEKTTLSPGDAVVVPLKIKTPGTFWQNFAPVMTVIGQAATTGAVIGAYAP